MEPEDLGPGRNSLASLGVVSVLLAVKEIRIPACLFVEGFL